MAPQQQKPSKTNFLLFKEVLMSDYKVIFKAVAQTEGGHALTWEPGCPALFTAVQVSRNTSTSAAFLQLKVRNVSSKVTNAAEYAMDQYGVIWELGNPSSRTFWWTYRDNEAFLFCRDNGEADKAVYVETRDGLRVKPEGNHNKIPPRWGAPSCIGVRPAVWVQL